MIQMLPVLKAAWLGEAGNNAWNDLGANGLHLTLNGNCTFSLRGLAPVIDIPGASGDYWNRADNTHMDILGTETGVDASYRGLTMGCWVRPDDAAGSLEFIMGKDDNSAGVSYSLRRIATGEASFRVSNTGNVLATFNIDSAAAMAADSWYFVAGRFDPSTTVDVWLNNVKASNSTSIPASIFNSASDFTIGAFHGGTTSNMDCGIALPFLCAAALPDYFLHALFQHTRDLFGA